MTLGSDDNPIESHLELHERNKRALEKILADLRLIVEEVETGLERAKEITSNLYPPEEPSGEKAPGA